MREINNYVYYNYSLDFSYIYFPFPKTLLEKTNLKPHNRM